MGQALQPDLYIAGGPFACEPAVLTRAGTRRGVLSLFVPDLSVLALLVTGGRARCLVSSRAREGVGGNPKNPLLDDLVPHGRLILWPRRFGRSDQRAITSST